MSTVYYMPEVVDKVYILYATGMAIADISGVLGIGEDVINDILDVVAPYMPSSGEII